MRTLTLAFMLVAGTVNAQYDVITESLKQRVTSLEQRVTALEQDDVSQTVSPYPSSASPSFNLDGSWTDVRDIHKLRNHLVSTHSYDRTWLNTLTLGQLWHLHDSTHGVTRTVSQPVVSYVSPGPVRRFMQACLT